MSGLLEPCSLLTLPQGQAGLLKFSLICWVASGKAVPSLGRQLKVWVWRALNCSPRTVM